MFSVLVFHILVLWGHLHESTGHYCMDQPRIAESSVGGSITLSCSFVYPHSEDDIESMNFAIKADTASFCGDETKEIYNSSTNSSRFPYQQRLNVTLYKETRNSSITIRNLGTEDNKKYCCRVEIKLKNDKTLTWQNPTGTEIRVKGMEDVILEQPSFIPALTGDLVTVLSRFKTENQTIVHNVTACRVWRSTGDTQECGSARDDINCTGKIGENILFFKINQVDSPRRDWYCYSIDVSTGDRQRSAQTKIGTNILILQPGNTLNISQPADVVFKSPTIINCSFSVEHKRDILWIGVYWMTGNPREDFVYHPDPDYIHPDYKGKTRLVSESNLFLEEFNGSDNTTFYCRVAIRRCLPQLENSSPNDISTILEEGSGTRLRVQAKADTQQDTQKLIIALCIGCVFLILLILLAVFLKKRKGHNPTSSGVTVVESLESSVYQNADFENSQMNEKQAKGNDLVYATVNHKSSSSSSKPRTNPDPDTEIVYADVKKT